MKVKRVLVSLMTIIFIALIAVPQDVYATQATNSIILGITAKRADTNFGYSIGGKPISSTDGSTSTAARLWDLLRYDSMTSATYHTDVDMFCLNAKYGFGSDDDDAPTTKRVEYTDYYNMKTQISDIEDLAALPNRNDLRKLVKLVNGEYKVGDNYNAILALGDMLYIKSQAQSDEQTEETYNPKMALLNAAGIKYDDYYEGYIHEESGKGPWKYLLTDDDIWAVEQAAIWYFTNADDSIYDLRENANNDMLLYYSRANDADSNPSSYASLSGYNPGTSDYDSEGKNRQQQAGILYNYLINTATQNASNYESQAEVGAPVRITTQQQYEETESNYIIGPIKIEKIYNIPFSVGELSVKNGNDTINYTILDKDKNITTKRGNDLVGDNFYISVSKDDIVSVTISADISYSKTTSLELWTRADNSNTQPILIPSKEPASVPLRLTVGPESPKQFDLALRKYIVKVNDANITNVRNQKLDVSKLNTLDDNGNLITTAKYPHRKDPVLVETGDIVKYQIKIYNEGEKDGRATKIVDQLPTGVKIKIPTSGKVRSTKGNEYTITEDVANNKVTFTTTGENNLNKYENETLDSDTIEFECEVTAMPNSQDNKILTNVAWISESYDAEADVKYSGNEIGHDRDSAPETHPNVNKDNMKDYKGNGNKDNLADNTYYYKGQQDDDDFEKLVLLPKKFDLALRKYITEVNGTNVTNTRNPQPDTAELNTIKDGNLVTTATYAHRKDPVLVETGDIVTYKITIYNEGEKAGRATEITDQLPTGVKIKMPTSGKVRSTKGNEYTITEDVANNKVTFATTGENNLNKFENETLDSDTIEFECEVTAKPYSQDRKILTNVAWISKSYDAEADVEYSENEIGHDRDSAPGTHPNVNKDNMSNYIGNSENSNLSPESPSAYFKGEQDDDDFEKLVLEPQVFDLKLIKNITAVNEVPVTERLKSIDVSKLNVATNADTTATYNMDKNPVSVAKGDIVTYRLRVYNEGTIDGYATEITEDIPEGLEFIWSEKEGEELASDTTLTEAEKEAVRFNQSYLWGNFKFDENREKIVEISTDYLSKDQETTVEGNLLIAFGKNDGTKTADNLSYKEVFVKMKVVSENLTGIVIRNEACISDDSDKDGNDIDDRDSKPEEWKKENDTKYYDEDHNWPVYKEDDEDYDNIILKPFDLALRKFIIAVSLDEEIEDDEYLKDDNGQYTRAPQVDTSKLNTLDNNGKMITTATYNHTKEPVRVKKNDIVVYMLRVYNEGETDGYAAEIKDHLPEYLEFVDGEYNEQYGWTVSENGRTVTTKYLANQKIGAATPVIGGITADGPVEGFQPYRLAYKEVPIMCRVKYTAKVNEKITNIADITEYLDEDKNPVNDRDSSEDNVKLPEDKDLPKYKDDEHGDYIPGQEDDDDFEKVIIPRFDLALRKQIVNIHNNYKNQDKAYNDRFAKLDSSKENTIYDYYDVESNIPTVVENDVVTYSIRVYNEGEVDGTATWVTDRLPSGLAYLPKNETNKQYGWKAYKQSTKDSQNAIKIGEKYYEEVGFDSNEIYMYATEYLKDSVIKAYTGTGEANYGEVKMGVRVKAKAEVPEGVEYKLRNVAEIGEDDNDDDDSIPGDESEWQKQDDVDIEELKLVEFDLALRKWVTEAIVIENEGTKNEKITVTPTGHQPYDDPEQVVKVDLHRRKLNQVTVKFRYSIRVINEGDIPGYAKEVTDYIPQGLKFVAEDNNGWIDEGDNVISTKLLENTLLQPGEYADVEVVLTWINSQDNMGVMVNTAEISQDENEYGVPDRDSVPDNQKPGEDDIDDAPVMLSITTGQERIYFILGFTVLITVAGGVILIKKYVL